MHRWSLLTVALYVGTAVLLALLLGVSSPPPEVEVPLVETRFDGERAHALVRQLALDFPNRVTGTPEDEAAAHWMAERLRSLGLEVVEQRFEVWGALGPDSEGRFAGVNVLGISPGQTEQAIVIGAHRDIVRETTQGAVDNASGSGTMLELARVLTAVPHRYTYVFASWGAEEVGLGGSRYYVGHPLRPTALALSVDVTGLVNRTELHLIDWASLPLEAALMVERMALEQDLISRALPRGFFDLAGLTLASGAATDSTPFAMQGIPALGVTWDTPHFEIIHTPRDTIEQVDADSLQLAGRLAERLVRVAEAQPPSFLEDTPHYLRRADGSIVPETQVRLAAAALVLFALANPAFAFARARNAGAGLRVDLHSQMPHLPAAALAAAVVAGAPSLLGLPRDPDGPRFLWWLGLAALGLVLVAAVARRAPPSEPTVRSGILAGLVALTFLGVALLANVFLAALVLAYPLVVLPRLSLRPRWWRALDALLVLPWIAIAFGLLSLAQAYASFAPEYAPALQVTLFQALVALLLYGAVGYSFVRRET